jgi:5-methylcytosine-specific restriction protein A
MPRRAKRPCMWPGCTALTEKGSYCDEHCKLLQARREAKRESAARRGYGARWRRLRKMFLSAHPLCADPYGHHAARNEIVVATEVDHVVPKKQGGSDAWENLQSLCKSCHSRKTALEDGRWG